MSQLQKILAEKNINLAEMRKFVETKAIEPKKLINMAKLMIVKTCTENKISIWDFVKKEMEESKMEFAADKMAIFMSTYPLFLAWEELERDDIDLVLQLQSY